MGLYLFQQTFYIVHADTFSVKISTDLYIWMFCHEDMDHRCLCSEKKLTLVCSLITCLLNCIRDFFSVSANIYFHMYLQQILRGRYLGSKHLTKNHRKYFWLLYAILKPALPPTYPSFHPAPDFFCTKRSICWFYVKCAPLWFKFI